MGWSSFDDAVATIDRARPEPRAQHVSAARLGMPKFTDADVLKVIGSWIRNHGYSPTVRELCEAVGCTSTSVMHYHLARLRANGIITWETGTSRSIRLVARMGTCPHCLGTGRIEESA